MCVLLKLYDLIVLIAAAVMHLHVQAVHIQKYHVISLYKTNTNTTYLSSLVFMLLFQNSLEHNRICVALSAHPAAGVCAALYDCNLQLVDCQVSKTLDYGADIRRLLVYVNSAAQVCLQMSFILLI